MQSGSRTGVPNIFLVSREVVGHPTIRETVTILSSRYRRCYSFHLRRLKPQWHTYHHWKCLFLETVFRGKRGRGADGRKSDGPDTSTKRSIRRTAIDQPEGRQERRRTHSHTQKRKTNEKSGIKTETVRRQNDVIQTHLSKNKYNKSWVISRVNL